jgi:hypothetical protein
MPVKAASRPSTTPRPQNPSGSPNKAMMLGIIQVNGPAEFFNHLSPTGQAFIMIVFASLFLASGLGLLRLGKYLVRGLRFLVSLIFDGARRLGKTIRRKLRRDKGEPLPASPRIVRTQGT